MHLRPSLGFLLLAALTSLVRAGSKEWITIQNPGFEDQVLSANAFTVNTPPGWQELNANGVNSFTEHIPGFSYGGKNHQGIGLQEAIWQDLTTTLTPNRQYTLVVAVGNRNATYTASNNQSVIKIQLKNGTTVTDLASRSVNGSLSAPGTFDPWHVSYQTGSTVPAGTLRIRLQVNSSERAHFDNVALVMTDPFTPPAGYQLHQQSPSWPQETVPLLNSRPAASAVLYLDFDGENFHAMPEWNGGVLFAVAPSGLTAVEIRRAFETVKEDFLPFNVNVTTDVSLYRAAPPGSRVRCVITPTDEWKKKEFGYNDSESGRSPQIMALGATESMTSFRNAGNLFDRDATCFVWVSTWLNSNLPTAKILNSGHDIGRTISHELGHTLGLFHDGMTSNPDGYFAGVGAGGTVYGPIGEGSSETGTLWAPIMGVGGYLSQWSRGEYPNAANFGGILQDDVAIISATGAGTNNFGFAPDGQNTFATAQTMSVSGAGAFSASGEIGRTSTGGIDLDHYLFTLTSQADVNVLVKPSEPFTFADAFVQQQHNAGIANLRMLVTLHDSSENLVANFTAGADTPVIPTPSNATTRLNPTEFLRARLSRRLSAGTYFIKVTVPVNFGNPATNGFSDYANMGAYSISGTASALTPQITSPLAASGILNQSFNYQATSSLNPVTWVATGLPANLSINSSTGVISGTPTVSGTFPVTLRAASGPAFGEATLTITISAPAAPVIQSPVSGNAEEGQPFSAQIVATGSGITYGVSGGLIPGLNVNSQTGAISGTPAAPGTWTMTLTATNGSGTGTLGFTLNVGPSITTALDGGLTFTRPDAKKWFSQTAVSFDNTDALQSPALNHGESSSVETIVTGPGTINYYGRTDSESGDVLTFRIDGGAALDSVSGTTGWLAKSQTVPSGTHTLRWTFARNASGDGGSNTAWLDRVIFQGNTGPVITSALDVTWTCGITGYVILTADDPQAVWSMTGTMPPGGFFSNGESAIIGGVITRPGTWSVQLSATNGLGTTTRTFTMRIESSYTVWARARGLAPGSELADPDKDGIPNIMELALFTNPAVRNVLPQMVTLDANRRLRASFNRMHQNFPDLMYEVQVSTNLQSWTTIARSRDGFTPQTTGALSVTETQVNSSPPVYNCVVIDNVQMSAASPRRMMRIHVTQLTTNDP